MTYKPKRNRAIARQGKKLVINRSNLSRNLLNSGSLNPRIRLLQSKNQSHLLLYQPEMTKVKRTMTLVAVMFPTNQDSQTVKGMLRFLMVSIRIATTPVSQKIERKQRDLTRRRPRESLSRLFPIRNNSITCSVQSFLLRK